MRTKDALRAIPLRSVVEEGLKQLAELLIDAHGELFSRAPGGTRRNDGTVDRAPDTYNKDKENEIGTIHASIATLNHVLALQMKQKEVVGEEE